MLVTLIKDEERFLGGALKVIAVCGLLALLVFLWFLPARADVDFRGNWDEQIVQAIDSATALSQDDKQQWRISAPETIREAIQRGADSGLVLDLAQTALDAGWTFARFEQLCQKVIAAQKAGRDPAVAARNIMWEQMTGKMYVAPSIRSNSYHNIALSPIVQAKEFISTVRRWLGAPYKYGGQDRNGVDCSGFVRQVYAEYGLSLPSGSYNQAKVGRGIQGSALRLGDIVVFSRPGKGVVHVGIYLNNGFFIHSAKGEGVHISNLDESKYQEIYAGARRVIRLVQS